MATNDTPAWRIDAGKLAEEVRFDGVQGDATAGRARRNGKPGCALLHAGIRRYAND
jgi:hypothetical protein